MWMVCGRGVKESLNSGRGGGSLAAGAPTGKTICTMRTSPTALPPPPEGIGVKRTRTGDLQLMRNCQTPLLPPTHPPPNSPSRPFPLPSHLPCARI